MCMKKSSLLIVGLGLGVLGALTAVVLILFHDSKDRTAGTSPPSSNGDEIIPARRGRIVDRNGTCLANNEPRADIIVDLVRLAEPRQCARTLAREQVEQAVAGNPVPEEEKQRLSETLARQLAADMMAKATEWDTDRVNQAFDRELMVLGRLLAVPLNKGEEEVICRLRQDGAPEGGRKRWMRLSARLDDEQQQTLQRLLAAYGLEGSIRVRPAYRRGYPQKNSLCHVLGYVDANTHGVNGIEKSRDAILKGCSGSPAQPPVPGEDIRLSIDLGLQQCAERALQDGMAATAAHHGAVILVDAVTGDILAMASAPGFDLNNRADIGDAALNFAVQGLFEPGGISRILPATAAWDEGKATPQNRVDCSPMHLNETVLHDGEQAVDSLEARECLTRFSIPGTARLGMNRGWTAYHRYLERYGLTDKTPIDLPGATMPRFSNGDDEVDFASMTIGYGMNVTPLHMAMAYAAIANDGVRLKPRLLLNRSGLAGTSTSAPAPEEAAKVMRPATAALLQSVMEENVQNGAGTNLQVSGVRVGGFTGCARGLINGYYQENLTTFSCAAFFPCNRPRYACVVVLEHCRTEEPATADGPDAGKGGREAAAAILRAVVREVMKETRAKHVYSCSDGQKGVGKERCDALFSS